MVFDLTNRLKLFYKSEPKMIPSNFEAIKKHLRRLQGRSDATKENHIQALTPFGVWCQKPFETLTEDDIYDYIEYLENHVYELNGVRKKYSASSKYQKLSTIKVFLKAVNPETVKAIKIKPIKNKKLPEEILTRSEIESLLNACQNARDRALLSLVYESGARLGEFRSLKIKNLEFDENGCVVTFPDGKTGARRIRLVFASSYLHEWLEYHPGKSNKDSFLFVSLEVPNPQLSAAGLKEQIVRIAKRAGVSKKVNPHAFRHSRATHLAEHLTEQQMKNFLGWTQGSSMAAVYVHLSGKDIDNAILKMNGIVIENNVVESLRVGRCAWCKFLNPEKSSFCGKCGRPLSENTVSEIQKVKNAAVDWIRENPEEFLKMLQERK